MRQLVTIGYEAVLKGNICVLSDAQGHLTLHLLWHETCAALFDDEALNAATIVLVSRPNAHVTQCCISNPALLAIENPASFNFTCVSLESSGITTILRLS